MKKILTALLIFALLICGTAMPSSAQDSTPSPEATLKVKYNLNGQLIVSLYLNDMENGYSIIDADFVEFDLDKFKLEKVEFSKRIQELEATEPYQCAMYANSYEYPHKIASIFSPQDDSTVFRGGHVLDMTFNAIEGVDPPESITVETKFNCAVYTDNNYIDNKYVDVINNHTVIDIPLFYGDVNGDKTVTASDALYTLQGAVGSVKLSEEQIIVADVTKDEKIQANDALYTLQFSVEKIDDLTNYTK